MSNDYTGEFGQTLNQPGGHALNKTSSMDATALKARLHEVTVLDLRSGFDLQNDARELAGAVRVSCTDLTWMNGLPKTNEYVLICGGYACGKCDTLAQRMVAAGFARVNLMCDSMDEMQRVGLPVAVAQ